MSSKFLVLEKILHKIIFLDSNEKICEYLCCLAAVWLTFSSGLPILATSWDFSNFSYHFYNKCPTLLTVYIHGDFISSNVSSLFNLKKLWSTITKFRKARPKGTKSLWRNMWSILSFKQFSNLKEAMEYKKKKESRAEEYKSNPL